VALGFLVRKERDRKQNSPMLRPKLLSVAVAEYPWNGRWGTDCSCVLKSWRKVVYIRVIRKLLQNVV